MWVTYPEPDEQKKNMDELYFDTKSVLSFNMLKFFKKFTEDQFDIKIFVEKNPEKAAEIKGIFTGIFG